MRYIACRHKARRGEQGSDGYEYLEYLTLVLSLLSHWYLLGIQKMGAVHGRRIVARCAGR